MTKPEEGRLAQEPSADEIIEGVCKTMHPQLEGIVHQYCDEAYAAIMESVQDYLIENAQFNIGSKIDAERRATVTAYRALAAVENSRTIQEARANAYAARKGYWSEERADEYRVASTPETPND